MKIQAKKKKKKKYEFKILMIGWCLVQTKKPLKKYVQLIDIYTLKMDDNHFSFIGVNQKRYEKDKLLICVYHEDGWFRILF